MNTIKVWIFLLAAAIKKIIMWGSDVGNLAKLRAQLGVLSEAAKYFGKQTKWEPFDDVANSSVCIAKTIQSVIDGRTDEEREKFVEKLNENQKNLKHMAVSLNSEKGIKVNWKGLTGNYNPIDGSAQVDINFP